MPRFRGTTAFVSMISMATLLAGCSGQSTHAQGYEPASSSPGATARVVPYVGYPDSLVMLGHSGSTGESSDPAQPVGFETRANSWATGTNPAVNSLYLRLLAVHPQIQGHDLSLSHGGARVGDLVQQASDAVAQRPPNPLIVIQIMDNDMVCPATEQEYADFQSTFESALAVLDSGLPSSRLFVVSQFGSPTTVIKTLTPAQRVALGGTGPCAALDPKGRLVPAELNRLEEIIHSYEARLKAGCLKFTRCRYDDGAFGNVIDQPQYTSPIDPNHFSIQGHAEAAAVAWAAMQRAGLVPEAG